MISIDKGNPDFLSLLPTMPGVYLFYDGSGKVLYVGKAKNLKNRISSYFSSSTIGAKTKLLISRSSSIDYFIVNSESEALLLENTLIKKYKPKYNILLKDDKTYPWIVIKNEYFPRVLLTRRVENDGSEYFGPYTSAFMVRNLLKFLKQLYPLRTCNLDLHPDKIKAGNYRVCLDFHIGLCKGPCVSLQTLEDYNRNIAHIREILKGRISIVRQFLINQMKEAAENYQFELAHDLKNKIELLEKYQSDSLVVNPKIKEVDVFSYAHHQEMFVVNYLHVVEGSLVHTYNAYFQILENETIFDLFPSIILQIRNKFASHANEIILPEQPSYNLNNTKYIVPSRGDLKKLLDLSKKNADNYLKFLLNKISKTSVDQFPILNQLKLDLGLKNLPLYIECFDNSNIQGNFPVSACVVFRNGKPAKNDYRHFHVKTVEGPDDYATMREIVYRRYSRLISDNSDLPQLIIIDGGKGQLNAAVEALQSLDILKNVEIISIAKRLEEIFKPGDSSPLYLNKRSSSLRLIQQIRDEAHRFGISFHRRIRDKKTLSSIFDSISGVGEKSKHKLLRQFGSIESIKVAPVEEIAKIIGESKAVLLKEILNSTYEF